MNLLTISGICKANEAGFALKDISFSQRPFQKIAIAGETGSGKSTLLRIIAGLIQPDAGTVLYKETRVKGPLEQLIPGHEHIGYLSQHYELRNHYRVEELLDMVNRLADQTAAYIFDICRIDHLVKRRSNHLSGGERQRIALAGRLISSPSVLLLDEPFSNLDPAHKAILKTVIEEIGNELNITCLLTSHDPQDTLSWADNILVLKEGIVVQQGTPEQLYRRPVDEYVAGLFGKYNLIPAGNDSDFPVFSEITNDGRQLLIRPEDFKIEIAGDRAAARGTVVNVSFWGSYYEIEAALAQHTIIVRAPDGHYVPGDTIFISLKPGRARYI